MLKERNEMLSTSFFKSSKHYNIRIILRLLIRKEHQGTYIPVDTSSNYIRNLE